MCKGSWNVFEFNIGYLCIITAFLGVWEFREIDTSVCVFFWGGGTTTRGRPGVRVSMKKRKKRKPQVDSSYHNSWRYIGKPICHKGKPKQDIWLNWFQAKNDKVWYIGSRCQSENWKRIFETFQEEKYRNIFGVLIGIHSMYHCINITWVMYFIFFLYLSSAFFLAEESRVCICHILNWLEIVYHLWISCYCTYVYLRIIHKYR